ncbi:hypothetical protein [Streptomyces sp. NBC_00687]|uniref:hypothetical protein n=1 Tax=Streptomyces sp. NBC_00687 TaxID=2975807 RepID=UPI00225A0A66|nr:hypothetical protein [Streptomyces sp. NBC_00687]MCX4912855.1 hypothetical protein [Streptomyces sp. NBC_00687]
MAKAKKAAAISDERLAEIRAGAHERNTAASLKPTCRCGVLRKPQGLAKYIDDDGLCVVHPDKPPQPYVPGYSAEDQ